MENVEQSNRLYLLTTLIKEEKDFDQIVSAVKAAGATVVKTENLGERTLAFPVKKHRALILASIFFTATSGEVKAINQELKSEEAVFRFLLTDWKADPDAPKRPTRPVRREPEKERAHV